LAGTFESILKIRELRNRILFTAALLAVFRVGTIIPTPGIDGSALAEFFEQAQGTIFGFFDMFSGGAFTKLSIFALGIMPYISASIILQLLTVVVPYIERLSKEGEAGRRKITQYTRYGTVILSVIQSFGIAMGLERMTGAGGQPIVPEPGWGFRLMTIITLTSGTAFIMWLGEQISERGIGNGISLIIFAGIVARLPSGIFNLGRMVRIGSESSEGISVFLLILILIVMLAVIWVIIYMERAQRRIPVQYAKKVVGRRIYGGQSTHLPLRINSAGVIPPIFASSLLMFPATIANFAPAGWLASIKNYISPGSIIYELVYIGLIMFFCYFYTAITFNPVDVSDNMKKHGGYIPGIRPGKKTAEYIGRVLDRITFVGAIYLSAVCVLPTILISKFNVPFYFGGTSLLIVVGVALDTIGQIESHMLVRHYDGFLGHKGGRIRGRK
jgi:preprotein translocase subunit SecY